MMVLFLTGFVSAMWIRYLRRDFARYDKEAGLTDFVSCAELRWNLVANNYCKCNFRADTYVLQFFVPVGP
jgi:hypothetical protein